ncbi:MAG: TonB-dependent receptor plug domain-containing protein [Bacteroidales bacterium]
MRNSKVKNVACHFKRWSRQSYAVFSSLGKVVSIGTLCIALLTSVATGQSKTDTKSVKASAKDSVEDKVSTLDGVEVVVAPLLSEINQTLVSSEIAASPSKGLEDLLEQLSSVDIRNRGMAGTQSDLSILGGNFDQSVLLFNGVNLTDPQTGHQNLSLNIPNEAIQQIELVDGLDIAKYGALAITGGVNIITKTDNSKQGTFSYGSYDTKSLSAYTGFNTGRFNMSAMGNFNNSDGYVDNTDYDNKQLGGQAKYTSANEALKIYGQYSHSQRKFGSRGFYTPAYPDQYSEEKINMTSGNIEFKNLSANMYYRDNRSVFRLFRNEAPSWYTNHNYHLNKIYGGALNYNIKWGSFTNTLVGINYRKEGIISNVLGEETSDTVKVPGEDIYYDKKTDRSITNLFAIHNQSIIDDKLGAKVLLETSFINGNENDTYFLPGIELYYSLGAHYLKFYAKRDMRLPTFTDLYYKGADLIGDSNLKPEFANNFKLSWSYQKRSFSAYSYIFYRHDKDLIDWVKEDTGDKWKSVNLTKMNFAGIELGAKKRIEAPNFLGVRSVSANYTYLFAEKQKSNNISRYAVDFLRNKFNLTVKHSIVKNLSLNWNLSIQERNGTYLPYEDGEYLPETDYKAFALLDAKLNWELGKFNVFAEGFNLFDSSYFDFGNLEQAGINGRIGVRISL